MSMSRFVSLGLVAGALAVSAAAMPTFSFGSNALPEDGTVVLYAGADGTLSELGQDLDAATGGRISAAITAMDLEGTFGETLSLPGVAPYKQVVVISKGEEALNARRIHDLGGHAGWGVRFMDGFLRHEAE